MAYKPVGVDDDSHFPPRVQEALADMFVTVPPSIADGQVPVWDASSNTWVAGEGGSGDSGTPWAAPPTIDGGIWDAGTGTWVPASGLNVPLEINGGTPSSWR